VYNTPILGSGSDAGSFMNWSVTEPKLNATVRCKISCSVGTFNRSDFSLKYRDMYTGQWALSSSITNMSASDVTRYGQIVKKAEGWYEFYARLEGRLATSFPLSTVIAGVSGSTAYNQFGIFVNANTYTFTDFRLDFDAPLTDSGVSYYLRLGHSFMNKAAKYLSPAVLRSSPSFYTGSFYTWNNVGMASGLDVNNGYQYVSKNGLVYGTLTEFDGGGNVLDVLFYRSTDYGANATLMKTLTASQYFFAGDTVRAAVSNTDPDTVWLVSTGPGVFGVTPTSSYGAGYTRNGGATWTGIGYFLITGSNNGVVGDITYSNGQVYVGVSNAIFTIADTNTTTPIFNVTSATVGLPYILRVAPDRTVFFANNNGVIRYTSGAFTTVLPTSFVGTPYGMEIAKNGYVHVGAIKAGLPYLFSSPTGISGTFTSQQVGSLTASLGAPLVAVDSSNNVFFSTLANGYWQVYVSQNNGGSWSLIDSQIGLDGTQLYSIQVSTDNVVSMFGSYFDTSKNAFYQNLHRYSTIDYNQSHVGPGTLATSVEYATDISNNRKMVLGNVSEFPHFGGLFQMKNLVLGTSDKGRIGVSDDSIVQVRHIGSVVSVLWPDQSTLDAPVPGFGESSIGQSPGNLSTIFSYGASFDTTDYDHVSLYCYALKQAVGTADDIVVQIQRRPLKSVGFATDQAVEYATSGSITEARYRDILHTKAVDYSDLSDTQVSFVIDVPLVNVREIRIGARHKVGQAAPNQNFLVWARFIDTKKET
jgi:hypothetical protein